MSQRWSAIYAKRAWGGKPIGRVILTDTGGNVQKWTQVFSTRRWVILVARTRRKKREENSVSTFGRFRLWTSFESSRVSLKLKFNLLLQSNNFKKTQVEDSSLNVYFTGFMVIEFLLTFFGALPQLVLLIDHFLLVQNGKYVVSGGILALTVLLVWGIIVDLSLTGYQLE